MDTINSFLDFIGSYPTWAKIAMLAGVLSIVCAMVFAPRTKTGKKNEGNDLSQIIESTTTAEEFKAKMLLSKEVIVDYLKQRSSYHEIDFAFNVKIQNETIDMVVFYHYKEQTQSPHFLFLVKYYDVKPAVINFEQLDNDWAAAASLIKYTDIRTALLNTKGFNSPIEYPDPLGGSENVRPKVIYNQVFGRRSLLDQTQLGQMQQINSMTKTNDLYRWLGTYDQLIEGLNFWSGS